MRKRIAYTSVVGRLVMSASGRLSKRSVASMAALVAAAHRLLGLVREILGVGGGVGGGRKADGARPVCSIVRHAPPPPSHQAREKVQATAVRED